MTALYSDTHPKMEQMQIELIRRMPAWKKFAIVDGLNKTMLVTQAFEQLGVLKTRAGELDVDYLRKWAKELKVSDLLEHALTESK